MSNQALNVIGPNMPIIALTFLARRSNELVEMAADLNMQQETDLNFVGDPKDVWNLGTEAVWVNLENFDTELMKRYQIVNAAITPVSETLMEVVVLFAWHGSKVGVSRRIKEKRGKIEKMVRRFSSKTWSLSATSTGIDSATIGDKQFHGGKILSITMIETSDYHPADFYLSVDSSGGGYRPGDYYYHKTIHSIRLRPNRAVPLNEIKLEPEAHVIQPGVSYRRPSVQEIYTPKTTLATKKTDHDDFVVPEHVKIFLETLNKEKVTPWEKERARENDLLRREIDECLSPEAKRILKARGITF